MNALDIVPLAPIAVPRRSLALGTYTFEIDTGMVIVGSDPHWTISQPTTTATKALVQLTARFAEEGSLRAIILAGDLPDFGQNHGIPRLVGKTWLPSRGAEDRQREARRD
jgi:hypothetical protein